VTAISRVGIVAAALQLIALVAALLGASAWPSAGLAAIVVAVAVGSRFGYWLGTATAVVLMMLLVLLALTASAALHLPMDATLAIPSAALSIGCLLAARRLPPAVAVPFRFGRLAPLLAASSGSALVMAALVLSQRLPDNLRLDWVMRNDSANNLIFARQVIARGGIAVGGDENPAPLPSALVGLTAAPFRSTVGESDLLAHDLGAMALTWAVLIALCCLLTGLVVASIVRRANVGEPYVTIAAGAGSLVVLSWVFSGYPMQFGFLNTHVALVVMLAALLAFLSSGASRWLTHGVLLCSCVVMLAVWSPLVVIPGALVAASIGASWPALRSTRGWRLAFILVAGGVLVAYVLAVTLPVLLAQRDALDSPGGVVNPGNATSFVVGAATIGLVIAVFGVLRMEAIGLALVVVFAWVGLGALLYLSRDQPDPFTYYPVKFSWLAELVFVVISLGLAISIAGRLRRWRAVRVAGMVAILSVVAVVVGWVPTWGERNQAQHPLAFIAMGNAPSGLPTLGGYILDFTGPDRPAILWKSGFTGESAANIWILQVDSGSLDSELRSLAFASYFEKDPAVLCRIQELEGPGLAVHTQDANLETELAAVCPDSTARIVVEDPRSPDVQ
jgi:hypothetical protein